MAGRHERAARNSARRLARTVGEPHQSTFAAGRMPARIHGAAYASVGSDDGKAPIDHWAILTGGQATAAGGWRGDYEGIGSGGLLIAEY